MQNKIPEPVYKRMRELAAEAHQMALNRALANLAEDFDRWRRGEMGPFDLAERIHNFHDGPNRDIWKQYQYSDDTLPVTVAHAVARGLVDQASIPPDVMAHIGPLIDFWREQP